MSADERERDPLRKRNGTKTMVIYVSACPVTLSLHVVVVIRVQKAFNVLCFVFWRSSSFSLFDPKTIRFDWLLLAADGLSDAGSLAAGCCGGSGNVCRRLMKWRRA